MSTRATILGSGTSHGIPMIGCDCAVCTSRDARDRRTRCCVVFGFNDRNLLVDTGPELRLQCVAADIRLVHAVWYTHHHADHVVGLDDLRRFNWLLGGPLPIYGNERTLSELRRMFAYAFDAPPGYESAIPALLPHVVGGDVQLFDGRVTPLPYFHGSLPVLGVRVGAIAYMPDVNRIPDETFALLRGLDVLVLDALRLRPHPTHFNLEEAIAVAQRIGAARTYFTHIAHELGHAATNASLPAKMELAFDGLVIESD